MEISTIKENLSIHQVLNYYGLQPDKNGMLRCPFHDDKTPSMQVYEKTNTAFCFSTNCKTHGKSLDVIDFILHKENCTKHEAIMKAKEIGGLRNDSVNHFSDESGSGQGKSVQEIYNSLKPHLSKSKKAQTYLKQRKLDPNQLEIQFNPPNSKYAHLKNCIVFPLKSCHGQTVSLYGRSITSSGNNEIGKHFYLTGRKGLYPNYPNVKTEKLILTEAIIDAATLIQSPVISREYSVLALYGTNGFTSEHQEALKQLTQLKEIILFFDGDQAGHEANNKYGVLLRELQPSISITKVTTPEGEDVNSLLEGHEPNVLEELIKNREHFLLNFTSVEEKKKVTNDDLRLTKEETTENRHSQLDTQNPHNLIFQKEAITYSIKGFKVQQPDSLKTTLRIESNQTGITLKLDLYEYTQIEKVCKLAAKKLILDQHHIEQDLYHLTTELEEYKLKSSTRKKEKILVPQDTASQCIQFLKSENLLHQISEMIGKAGIIGEEVNRLLLFIIASSYKMPDTLHALIQGSSGSGKTQLLKVISSLMPEEEVKKYTRVTDNSFYNQDEHFFVNKLICFEDLDGLKEDAQLAVRELQSNEILVSSTSVKDKDGGISGGERIVRGPIASLSCTTKGEVYEDNISRCFLIAVDESDKQTQRIIDFQNRRASGQINSKEKEKVTTFAQNCMRLLQRYEVINPYATKIKLPERAHKIRRLNELYQSFVRQITLLHQYQRQQDGQGRLITEKEDLQLACEILFESIILKVDELDGSLRQFFESLKDFVSKEARLENVEEKEVWFNRFEVRQEIKISKTQQHRYFNQLIELEYLEQKGFANKGFQYRIKYWDNLDQLRNQIGNDLERQLALL